MPQSKLLFIISKKPPQFAVIVMFNPDSLVVYPAHGVGIVERIQRESVDGVASDLYIVRIRASNVLLMVPVQNALSVGLRPLIPRKRAQDIFRRLKESPSAPVVTGQNWNRRFREYTNRLKSPDLAIVANVLHELLRIGRDKELSFGEKRLLEQAMTLVSGELGEVLECAPEGLREELLSIYAPEAAEA